MGEAEEWIKPNSNAQNGAPSDEGSLKANSLMPRVELSGMKAPFVL